MAIQQGATSTWTKSSYSTGNGACVEVKSPIHAAMAVRDSKVPSGPTLAFPADSWNSFVAEVSRGAFDLI
ncbi:DUF397 domain-containing protein [Streptomyces sp. ME02-8801-2C]|uniref:DUF397 domain-containing protein n=1 Tax=unclassified Streptomyces TaxID=2593676 RepID=UPI0029B46B50|nr:MULTISPECIES: DUF397 domain-containing protein [unclassified Streptomyces]MDX3455728.1 DUF397 domain-containing protein [Streptomyces sp. ME02-8801-2C]WUB72143.1 DUF397 domain-containing protein [Streptomyces sp. NBC_00576]